MKESALSNAKQYLRQALDRLYLEDVDEEDIQKAEAKISDAEEQLERATE